MAGRGDGEQHRRRLRLLATAALAASFFALLTTAPASAQELFPAYCDPANSILDPADVPAEGSAAVAVPGVDSRELVVNGIRTRLLEAGAPRRRSAVVFLHGSPGSGADFAELIGRLGTRRTRAVAFDLPGYGQAEESWDKPRDLANAVDFVEDALGELGIRRVHLVAHDVGGHIGLEWAARHPRLLRSVTVIDTGLLLGYRHHQLAQISRSPGAELFWQQFSRASFSAGIQQGQDLSHQLPADFVNRLYDDLDRETRCAIIDLYRTTDEPEINAVAERQARVLARRKGRPALVLWGANDPYLPVEMASRQTEGFPAARIEIFERSGHWPFVDFPAETERLVVPFIRDAVKRDRARRRARHR